MSLIVIEGLDGAGKSTQIEWMQRFLAEKGVPCRYIHFPRTDAPVYGDLVARFLRGDLGSIDTVNPYLVALMYAGDRYDFKPKLKQWLSDGSTVLLDRYVYSNIAYQCAKIPHPAQREELRKWILDLEFGYHGLPIPDANIFLDVPFLFTERKLSETRKGDDRGYLQGKSDIHEADLNFQRSVREVYLSLQDTPGFLRIDCADEHQNMLPPQAIFENIRAALTQAGVFS
jgi:dTMP kinase